MYKRQGQGEGEENISPMTKDGREREGIHSQVLCPSIYPPSLLFATDVFPALREELADGIGGREREKEKEHV